MILHERHREILNQLFSDGVVYTSRLKDQFGTSFETIRKDLKYLEEQGLLARVHGGAVPVSQPDAPAVSAFPSLPLPLDFLKRCRNHREQKQQIAAKACQLIQENTCIALDTGTTSYELAGLLMERFTRLTIVTNSMVNALLLSQKSEFTIIVTGGIVSHQEKALISELAVPMLQNLNIDIMFLTTCGIDLKTGIAEQNMEEISIHKHMACRSRRLIVLADSSKFSRSASFHAYHFEEISSIITDDQLDEEIARKYRKLGVDLVIA